MPEQGHQGERPAEAQNPVDQVDEITDLLQVDLSRDAAARDLAETEIRRGGKSVVPAILTILADQGAPPGVRRQAAWALGVLGEEADAASDNLSELARNRVLGRETRIVLLGSLILIDRERAKAVLGHILKDQTDAEMHFAAEELLAEARRPKTRRGILLLIALFVAGVITIVPASVFFWFGLGDLISDRQPGFYGDLGWNPISGLLLGLFLYGTAGMAAGSAWRRLRGKRWSNSSHDETSE